LRAAETMKYAVDILEPQMKKKEMSYLGSIIMATVWGDVHDIGKNLVDIILTNNGYQVYNIGINQSIDDIMKALKKHKPDFLGLSGLLVKSCVIMKEFLETFNDKGIEISVICGGAALTRSYVQNELNKIYTGNVFYANDAFEAIKIMEKCSKNQK